MDVLREIRVAVRSLRRNITFSALAVFTLALGIGAITAIFSVVDAIVRQPLPYPDPDELVRIGTEMTDGRQTSGGLSPLAMEGLIESSRTIEHVAGSFQVEVALRDAGDRPLLTDAYLVTEAFFDVLAKPVALGRGFVAEEFAFPPHAAVLSHRFWATAFNSDPAIIGRQIPNGRGSVTVVGVTDPAFDYPAGADVWLAARPPDEARTAVFLEGVARLNDGATQAQARSELEAMSARFAEESASFEDRVMRITGLQEWIVGDTRQTLLILFAAALTLLLIASANVMSLTLSRDAGRQSDVAVRAALGAGQAKLVRQLIIESLVVATAGALMGVGLARGVLGFLAGAGAGRVPRLGEVALDGTALAFVLATTALTGLVVGLVPAFRLAGTDIRTLMGGTRGAAGGRRAGRIFDRLVVVQTSLAVALVIAAALLVRSYTRLLATDGGFDSESVLVMDANLPPSEFTDFDRIAEFYRVLVDEIGQMPGVAAVGAGSSVPLHPSQDGFLSVYPEGFDTSAGAERARYRQVTPGFFEAMGIEILEGRAIEDVDRLDAAGVAVVNNAFAQRVLGGEPALGQVIRFSQFFVNPTPIGHQRKESFEIVGVADDVRFLGLDTPADPAVYLPHEQATFRRMFVTARVSGADPMVFAGRLRDTFHEMAPTLPVELTTMDRLVDSSLASKRLAMYLLLGFAFCSAVLAAVGMYGVISMSVVRRTSEIAIRSALGAQRGHVLWKAMARGLALAGIGVALGVALAIGGQRWLRSQLYEITPTDPLVLIGVSIAFGVVACAAVFLPAVRALRIDPARVLRV